MWYIDLTWCEKGAMMMSTRNTGNKEFTFTRKVLADIKRETEKLLLMLSGIKGGSLGISEVDMEKFLSGVGFLKDDVDALQFSLNKLRKEARETKKKADTHRASAMKVRKG